MKGTIEWFARNSVAANLMMVFIMVSGIIAMTTVQEELMPQIELDRINIQVPYLGAAPEEVEAAVTVRIEEAPAMSSRSTASCAMNCWTERPFTPSRTPRA